MPLNDAVIIGAGPAGVAAAIQLKRCGLRVVVFEKNRVGGLLANANLVENYPGFPTGISGTKLCSLFERQIRERGIDVIFDEVLALDYNGESFTAWTPAKKVQAKTAIIASGTRPKEIGGIDIRAKNGNQVAYEITHLQSARDKNIAIIGTGDAAFDYALSLSNSNKVTILNRGSSTRCLPLLSERAYRDGNIEYRSNIQVQSIVDNADKKLTLNCISNGEKENIGADYVVLAVGREKELDFMSENLLANQYQLERDNLLYIIGDANTGIYRQTAIAVGEGVMAAMKIERKIRGLFI